MTYLNRLTPGRHGFDVSAQPNVRKENAEKPPWSQPTSHFPTDTLAFFAAWRAHI